MANGDVENPNAWASGSDTLSVGTPATPPAQGGLAADGGGKNGDPDFYIGSFALQSVAPTLALGSVGAPAASGDVDAVYGVDDQQGSTLPTWSAVAPTLATQTVTVPSGKGQQENPESWSSTAPSLSTGTIPAVPTNGDVGEMYGWVEGFIGQLVWAQVAPTLGLGSIAAPIDKGDIPNPFAWQDATFYLTSQPYPLVVVEDFTMSGYTLPSGTLNVGLYRMLPESFNFVGGVVSGSLTIGMIPYSNWPPESFNVTETLKSGTLVITTGYVAYTNWPAESFNVTETLNSGSLTLGLIIYSNWPAEAFNETITLASGSLT